MSVSSTGCSWSHDPTSSGGLRQLVSFHNAQRTHGWPTSPPMRARSVWNRVSDVHRAAPALVPLGPESVGWTASDEDGRQMTASRTDRRGCPHTVYTEPRRVNSMSARGDGKSC